ncbi:MAG: pilus assembly protein PilP [Deltaproteobacteria bacterium]|nr:pilus assembly protein PilP [Deltaproteobacteria bacterium]
MAPKRKWTWIWLAAFLASMALLCDCGSDRPPPPPPPPPKQPVQAKVAELDLAAEAAADSFIYTPVGKRDPFKSQYRMPKARTETGPSEVITSPLQQFEIDQLKLIAVVSGISQPRAMVEGPGGKGYTVKIGTRIGKNFGKVVKIKSSELIIAEDYRDWNGRKVTNYIHMEIKKEQLNPQP